MTSVTFEGIKYSYNQRQAGIVIAFVVHPENMPDYVALAPLGSRVMVTLTEITDVPTEKPGQSQAGPAGARRKFDEMSRAEQAGLLCNDKRFQDWLGVDDKEDAAKAVRYRCMVKSRSELDSIQVSSKKWDDMVTFYRADTGQSAEQRG